MAPMEIHERTLTELAAGIAAREFTCREVMAHTLERIERLNTRLTAIVDPRDPAECLAAAEAADAEIAVSGPRSVLHGVPWAFKDLLEVEGQSFTRGSRAYADARGQNTAPMAARILAAGAIPIGRTNTPELGFGSQSWNRVWGTTTNPYAPDRTAGGSSGGAAAAVASRMLAAADGSDYMGSLRNPAAWNNLVSLRPSWGTIPARGFLPQMSVLGPMARTIGDLAALMPIMAGDDRYAPLHAGARVGDFAHVEAPTGTLRVAWVGDLGGRLATQPGILEANSRALDVFRGLGHEIVDLVPDFDHDALWEAFLAWRQLGARSHAALAEPGVRDLVKDEALWELDEGAKLTVDDLLRADAVRQRWFETVVDLFDDVDLVVAPAASVAPFDAAVHWPREVAGRPMDTYHRWMETVLPWSMAAVPVVTLPTGPDRDGLPTGVQVVGGPARDAWLLGVGLAYEGATDWARTLRPQVV